MEKDLKEYAVQLAATRWDDVDRSFVYELLMNTADGVCSCATDKEIKPGASPEYCPSCKAAKILNRFYEDARVFIEEMARR